MLPEPPAESHCQMLLRLTSPLQTGSWQAIKNMHYTFQNFRVVAQQRGTTQCQQPIL